MSKGEIMEKHFMIDIETTGVNKVEDEILEIALVEIEFIYPYWKMIAGREYHQILHYSGEPITRFAKDNMVELYKKCNETDKNEDYAKACTDIAMFIHEGSDFGTPKFFMGWNASNFDMPFMFEKKILTPSYYEEKNGKETLKGDAHYRIYEQTGSLNVVSNLTGFSTKTIKKMAEELNPTEIILPQGKQHDALYDCYWQIVLMNGLIEIGRLGINKRTL